MDLEDGPRMGENAWWKVSVFVREREEPLVILMDSVKCAMEFAQEAVKPPKEWESSEEPLVAVGFTVTPIIVPSRLLFHRHDIQAVEVTQTAHNVFHADDEMMASLLDQSQKERQ